MAQVADTSRARAADTTLAGNAIPVVIQKLQTLLQANQYLNSKGMPTALKEQPRHPTNKNAVFYLLAGILLFFGIIKTVFDKYFSTLFRVFFNSSLRQSQLTDQLMQATVPSMFFNLLFVVVAGSYAYFLLPGSFVEKSGMHWIILLTCMAVFLLLYGGKYIAIKLLGWVTGYKAESDIYIFIVFLVNKIIAICLLPVLAVLAFSDTALAKLVVTVSLVFIGLLLLFRFMRSYGLLASRMKVNRFHFLLYVFSFEILPVIIIYKAISFFILKNG